MQIKKLLSELSPDDRFLLISRELEALSFKEIAFITGRQELVVRNHCRQLKDSVRKTLEKNDELYSWKHPNK